MTESSCQKAQTFLDDPLYHLMGWSDLVEVINCYSLLMFEPGSRALWLDSRVVKVDKPREDCQVKDDIGHQRAGS
ncbi:hypothetical protein BLOT_007561 [Blomia tropicalis]|nr:hypothetical protein BLOT_007561 [Blomia tropicalis]